MTTVAFNSVNIARNQATMAEIQHLEDAIVNPFTGEAWPAGREAMLQGRRKLPVYGKAADLLEMYHKSQVIILSSETGSGKSTQVPQMLVYDEYSSDLSVGCTQPRKLAAKALAQRVADEMGVAVGDTVGFQVGGKKVMDKKGDNTTRLLFMTERVLVNQAMADRDLSKYACVIVDEAHERTMDADILVPLLKEVTTRRNDFKIIIMSATTNGDRFQQYFNLCYVSDPRACASTSLLFSPCMCMPAWTP